MASTSDDRPPGDEPSRVFFDGYARRWAPLAVLIVAVALAFAMG